MSRISAKQVDFTNFDLNIQSLELDNQLKIGNLLGSPGIAENGMIRFNGTNFQGYKNSAWYNLDTQNIENTRSFLTDTIQTTNNTETVIQTISNLPNNELTILKVFIKAVNTDGSVYGIWLRTLAVSNFNGVYTLKTENIDVDDYSTGLTANSVNFYITGSPDSLTFNVTGLNGTTLDWTSKYEII